MKGWRDGVGVTKVEVGGDSERVGIAAGADGIVAVGGKFPPMISKCGLGWEGLALSVRLGARGRW